MKKNKQDVPLTVLHHGFALLRLKLSFLSVCFGEMLKIVQTPPV